jgi:ferredoxin-type protein NapH
LKRQSVRQLILLLSWLLFPVIFYFLSPYLLLMGALEKTIAGDTIVFFVLFLSGLIFSRLFCGWLCPVGGLQEICISIQKKPANPKYNWTKFLIWIPWMLLFVWILISRGFFTRINFLYQTEHGISLGTTSGLVPYITYYGVLSLFLITTLLFGRRGFCHYGCWVAPFIMIGSWLGNVMRFPKLRLEANKNCSHCLTCNKYCPMSLDVQQMVQKGRMDNSECILCGTCIDVCPTKVIRYRM